MAYFYCVFLGIRDEDVQNLISCEVFVMLVFYYQLLKYPTLFFTLILITVLCVGLPSQSPYRTVCLQDNILDCADSGGLQIGLRQIIQSVDDIIHVFILSRSVIIMSRHGWREK